MTSQPKPKINFRQKYFLLNSFLPFISKNILSFLFNKVLFYEQPIPPKPIIIFYWLIKARRNVFKGFPMPEPIFFPIFPKPGILLKVQVIPQFAIPFLLAIFPPANIHF
jgi:hypothetical protein